MKTARPLLLLLVTGLLMRSLPQCLPLSPFVFVIEAARRLDIRLHYLHCLLHDTRLDNHSDNRLDDPMLHRLSSISRLSLTRPGSHRTNIVDNPVLHRIESIPRLSRTRPDSHGTRIGDRTRIGDNTRSS